MKRLNATAAGVIAMASLLLPGQSMGQTSGYQAPTSALQSTSLPERKELTPEEIEANGEKTVIIHFMTTVTPVSALSLVILIQGYYKDGYRNFVIPIQTGGGSVSSALYAYETLTRMPISISTVAVGDVDSSGVALFCIGKKRYASPSSSFLFHPMSGSMNPNHRAQEAAQRKIDNMSTWFDNVTEKCIGKVPEAWDLDRRDYRVLSEEASEVGLVNSGADYFEDIGPIGDVTYMYPYLYAPGGYTPQ